MRLFWNLSGAILILLIVTVTTTGGSRAPRSFYRRNYYTALSSPSGPPIRLSHKAPSSYPRADLQVNESKKYPKKTHYRPYVSEEDDYSGERYNSGEFSNEGPPLSYGSREQDSREYTIGTQIRVQHPITIPKKASSSNYSKQPKYVTPVPQYKNSGNGGGGGGYVTIGSGEEPEPSKRHNKYADLRYQADPFHLVPPPKSTSSSTSSSNSNSYSVFEADNDDYDVVAPSARTKPFDRYKGVASKKQIEAFLEDQQKLLNEAIKLQLLSNPKLKKFLKSSENEPRPDLDIEDFESYPPNFSSPGPLRNAYSTDHAAPFTKSTRTRRRPPGGELKRSPKTKTHLGKPKRKYRSTALVINV